MIKKLFTFSLIFSLFLVLSPAAGAQQGDSQNQSQRGGGKVKHYAPLSDQAAQNGDYDVENQPEMKVKVFVYKDSAKTVRPTLNPVLICSPDNDSLATVGDAGWRLPKSITYRLNVTSVPSSVGSANLPAIAGAGFAAWTSNLPSGKVATLKGANTSESRARYDGQNIIAWGRTSANTLGVTYIWYNTTTKVVSEVDTIMSNSVAWKWNKSNTCGDSSAYDAQNILTHEQGHWFGLNDQYAAAYIYNTMYGYGSKGEVKKITPTTGDINGLKVLYP